MYSHLFTECGGGWDAIKIIWKYICFIAKVHKGTKRKTKGERREGGWPTGLPAFGLWLCGQVQLVPIAFFGWKIYVYTFFSLFSFLFTHRESCRSLESGKCYKSDIAVQANNARLQWGGIMQHYKGLAGYCYAVVRNAGIYATARGIFGWVASTAQSPRCKVALWYLAKVLPTASKEWGKNVCVCDCVQHFCH